MTARDYREALSILGLTQTGAAAFLCVNPRTSRRWAETDPGSTQAVPVVVMMLLKVMVEQGLSVEDVQRIVAADLRA